MIIELAISITAVIISVLALLIAILRLGVAIYPLFIERRNRKILTEKFGRGPYDEPTIERSTKFYILPKCTNLDPAQEQEPRHALVATREILFAKVDEFIDQYETKRHLLILADSGTGKTSFVLNYYVHNSRKPRRKQHQLALIYLGAADADQQIADIIEKEQTVLIMDALDEDSKAIADHKQRIRDLMHACSKFLRIIITCRTQFFSRDEEIPVETGIVRIGPKKAGDKGVYEFWKLYLAPLDDTDIENYFRRRFPIWQLNKRMKARAAAAKIPLLSARPMLLTLVPDLVKSGREIKFSYELYEIMVEAWLERESTWVNKSELRRFSENLAVNLYVNREARGTERIPHIELINLASEWKIDLQGWQLSGRSLLNRDAQGNFKFSHRSIMEYLFIRQLLLGNPQCMNESLTDHMEKFVIEICQHMVVLYDSSAVLNPSITGSHSELYSSMVEISKRESQQSPAILFVQAAWFLQRGDYIVEKRQSKSSVNFFL